MFFLIPVYFKFPKQFLSHNYFSFSIQFSQFILLYFLQYLFFIINRYSRSISLMEQFRMFYLLGKNKKNSLSPLLHNKLFELKGKDNYRYEIYQDGILPTLGEIKSNQNFGGVSISIPFKKTYEESAEYLSGMSIIYGGQFAQKTKIINTLVKEGENQKIVYKGYNTDIYGIKKVLSTSNFKGNALVLGGGATAETFCFYLQNLSNCENVFVNNRTQSKIYELKKSYNKVKSFKQYQKSLINLVINSLPTQVIKQFPTVYEKIIQNLQLPKQVRFMDVNYRNKEKVIQNAIEKKGCLLNLLSGLDMLIWQAIEQNRYFCKGIPEKQQIQNQYFMILKKLTNL